MSEKTRKRWAKGGYAKEIRVMVRCLDNHDHAKNLRFDGNQFTFEQVVAMAAVFDGTSPAYILKPSANSPIGKCAVCGGQLEATTSEVYQHAERSIQNDQPGGDTR